MGNTLSNLRYLVLMAVLACGNGCGGPAEGPDGDGTDQAGATAKYTIGMSQCTLDEPWRVQMNAHIKAAADKNPDLKVIFQDAEDDALKQRAHVAEFVSAGVDLIIISPKEAQPLTEPIGQAIDAGIPVIVLDRAIIGDKYTCFIGADNKKIGEAAGNWLVEKLGGKGKIVELMGLETSKPGQDRYSGFHAALKNYPDIRMLHEAPMEWKEAKARQEMEGALSRHAEIDAVYAHNDPAAHGAYQAAKAAGREKGMLFIGIDALPHEGVMYVAKGMLDVTFEYPTGGARAIEEAVRILEEGQPSAKNIELKTRFFTKENVDRGGEAIE